MTHDHETKHRGFATIVAVLMLTMVSLALMAMATRFADDTRRTRDGMAAAQLRSLLLAGVAAAQHQLKTDDRLTETTIMVPPVLAARRATLTLETEATTDQALHIRVEATLGQARASQQLQYVRSDPGWRLASAHLEQGFRRNMVR